MHKNSIRDLEFDTVRHFPLNLSVSLEFLLRNERLARVSTPPYSFGSSFNASISIWFEFLIRIVRICRTPENQPLEFAIVRHFLLNLSVSPELLLTNQRLARVSTPPYAFGSSFNASICSKRCPAHAESQSTAQATQTPWGLGRTDPSWGLGNSF